MKKAICLTIAVLALLCGCARDPYGSAKERRAACQWNLKQIYVACEQYEQKYGAFPFASQGAPAHEHLQLLVDTGFVTDPKVFICPSARGDYPAELDKNGKFKLTERTCSYAYSSVQLSCSSEKARFLAAGRILAADKSMHHNGLNKVSGGGVVEWHKAQDGDTWEKLTKNQLAK